MHLAGAQLPAGLGFSTVLPAMDFETYSEAGYYFTEDRKWKTVIKSANNGLAAVGASAYSEHPSTEVLCLAYDLKDARGVQLWIPAMPPPQDLFDYLNGGGLMEAWNSGFEYFIWNNVCAARMGWPALDYTQTRDAMAKARAFGLPGKLEKAAEVAGVRNKIADGKRLINKFSKPRTPTKNDPRQRILPQDEPGDAVKLYAYCIADVEAECAVSEVCPDLSPQELDMWLLDQKINFHGVAVDLDSLAACKSIVEQAFEKYTAELPALTGGVVETPGQTERMAAWLQTAHGVSMPSMTADAVTEALKDSFMPAPARRLLEIRQALGLASIKKLFSMHWRISADGMLRDLFAYFGARTGRAAGRGPQPQNLPASGPDVWRCDCGRHYVRGGHLAGCPWCHAPLTPKLVEWNLDCVTDALEVIALRDLATVEHYFGPALNVISACLRGLFVATEDHDLICSDFSAIEAVDLAELAGEEWRREVFRTHGKIYEESASRITGVPFEEFMQHKERTGDHHPLRKKIGKYAELASGYQGFVGAWVAFGADKHLSEDEIKEAVMKWRADSPAIVAYWKGLQAAAVEAIRNPGECFSFRSITYGVQDDVLYCKLPSGRSLIYHCPLAKWVKDIYGRMGWQISFMGWDSTLQSWRRIETYGGKLTENVVQAVARDQLIFAMLNLDRAGYMIVLHVHDEAAANVLKTLGSVEEMERIMSTMPDWCADWPVKAAGGWRGFRYRKD